MAIIFDGKAVSAELIQSLKKEIQSLHLQGVMALFVVGSDDATRSFVAQKKKIADELGLILEIVEHPVSVQPLRKSRSLSRSEDSLSRSRDFLRYFNTENLGEEVALCVKSGKYAGIVVQLPLPSSINTQEILNLIPADMDPDVLSAEAVGKFIVGEGLLPPVVGAIAWILQERNIDLKGKTTAVIGKGRLVGQPMLWWFERIGSTVISIDNSTTNPQELCRKADIVVSGAGKPHLVDAGWIKEGAIVIDAGTSESSGKVLGDVDFESVVKKASFITPVPGGVGPVATAFLWKNFVELLKLRK